MASYTQQDRQMEIHTPLGEDVLLLSGFDGAEEFNKLFRYRLQLLSTKDSIAAKDIIGKPITFSIKLRDKARRFFNGYVARFAFKGKDERFSSYVAEIVPWTWFLTQTKDCRMFQDKTVPQIIQEIFADFSMAKFEIGEVHGTHEKWDYCVQYRESDFDFICRLMEQEGIYFYYRHEDGKHTMVMGDTPRGYKDAEEKEASLKATLGGDMTSDNLLDWERVYEFRPAKFSHADYNFETPSASMEAKAVGKSDLHGTDKFEIFEFPGEYETKTQGEADARIRIEEIAAGTDVVHGRSVNASWGPGRKFTIEQHHIAAEEGNQYVLCSVAHHAKLAGAYHAAASMEVEYTNTFTAIAASKTFRPERVTPKPFVRGCQTAMVVGPAGETIHVDEYGRVKVHFYWDRRSKKDDTSSCWMRVSQNSGGGGWGGVFNPHVGHEVIVSFLEGDPDRPIITGRVYNAERANPGSVAKKTQSVMRDHGGNQIIMEGAGGSQRLTLSSPHATTTLSLGAPNSPTSGIYATTDDFLDITVGKDETVHIIGSRKQEIDHNETVSVHGTRTHTITLNNLETNKIAKELNVVAGYSVNVGGAMNEIVIGAKMEEVGVYRKEVVKGFKNVKIGRSLKETIGTDHTHTVKGALIQTITKNTTIDCKAEILLEAADKITLKCGPSTITLDKDGTIQINGQTVDVNATKECTVAGKEKLDMEGGELLVQSTSKDATIASGADMSVKAKGHLKVEGNRIDLN